MEEALVQAGESREANTLKSSFLSPNISYEIRTSSAVGFPRLLVSAAIEEKQEYNVSSALQQQRYPAVAFSDVDLQDQAEQMESDHALIDARPVYRTQDCSGLRNKSPASSLSPPDDRMCRQTVTVWYR